MSTVCRVTILPIFCTWCHIHILQCDSTSLSRTGVLQPQSIGNLPSQALHLGHMSTISRMTPHLRPCAWGHMSNSLPGELPPQNLHLGSHVDSLQGDPSPYTQHLGSNVHTLQGDNPPRHSSWGYMSTVSVVTPTYQTLHLWSPNHSLQGDNTPQTVHMGSHVHILQGNPTSLTLYGVSQPQSSV